MKKLIIGLLVAVTCLAANASEQPIYIDVRTWAEHQVNNIEGDPRIHVSEIVDGVTQQFPDKSTAIRLYCARGVRAQTALERLQAAGYTNLENAGGIEEVRQLRFPESN